MRNTQRPPFGTEEREKMLREFLTSSRRLDKSRFEDAVRDLRTVNNEHLARSLYNRRQKGVTLETLAKSLRQPVRRVRCGLATLRKKGFVWYAHEESAKTYRYFLLDVK